MDKRKGIILAIVLFLIIGLGTFVFAGGSDEGSGDGTITPQPDGGDDNDPTNPSDPTTEDDGNITEGEDEEDTTRPTGGNDNTDGDELVTDGEGENNPTTPTVDYKALLDELANMVESATSKEDLAEAEQFRKDNNITEENVAALDDDAASETYDEVIAILTDNASPVVTPDDLNGSFTNKDSVSVEITDTTDVSYTLTINGEEVTDADLANLTEEGNYKLTVTDSAFNSTTITFTVDRTNPVLLVNDEEVENGETIYVNEDAKMTVDETNLESFTSNGNDRTESILKGSWTAQNDGPYNIVVTDKAGNETSYTIVRDTVKIEVNHLYVKNNTHEDYNVSEENRYKVIGNGQELYVEYVLKEEFTSTPILTIGGKEYKMTCDVASWNDELYKCDAHVTISEDMNLVNGEVIPFTITGVKDIAGNETIVTEKDTTVSDKYGKVVYDNDPAQSIWVYILNADEDHRTIIGNNQKLIVEINVNEELLVNPVITIGDYQVELTRRANDSRYIYSKTITIDADKMKLVHDENIAFTISVTDVAGKTTTLDNKNVTIHEEKGYGQVKYDGEAPEYVSLGMQNNDHTSSHENGDITVANIGDHIRVLIRFDELLAITPKIRIGDSEEFELKLHTDYENFEKYTYWADIELTKDMNLADGALEYVIYGYADAFGNVGKNLSSTDEVNPINNPSLPGVTLDTEVENPEWIYTLNLSDKNNRKTIKDGQTLRVEANFTEELVTTPVLTIGDSQSVAFRKCEETSFGKYVCVADIVIDNSIANLENNKVIPIKITNIEDKGGNTLELDNSYITETTEYGEVTYDNEAPVYTSLGLVNMTHFDEDSKGDNLYVANVGDKLRVIIFFDELLATDPTVTIGGVSEKLHHDEDWENYGYWADIEITEEMNLEDGNIDFVVSGYADAVGNVGVDLTSKDIKNSPHKGVRLDTVAAKKHAVYLWANTESVVENIDGKDYVVYYVTNGDVVTATISVNEILGENPKFVIGYNGGSYDVPQDQVIFSELDDVEDFKYVYSAQITIPEDVKTENTELTLTVYNVVDQAGNVTNNGEAIGISNVNRIFVDTTAPELTLVGKEETYDNILRIEAGTEITLEDVLATATDASFDGEITVEPYRAEFYANTGIAEDNDYTYDFSNGFDTRKPTGSRYNIYYKVTDKAGNTTEDVMILAISDTTAATITPNQDDNYHVEYGSEYTSVTAKVTDNVDETDIIEPWEYIRFDFQFNNLGEVYYNNTFDTTKPGRYLAIWDYKDSSGNVSDTLKRWVIVSDTTAPALVVDTVENEVSISDNPQVHATDLQEFEVVIKLDGKEVKRDKATLNSEGLYSVWFGIGHLADGDYVVEATDAAGNTSKEEFTLIRLNITDSDVGSNLIDTSSNTINNFNSFAVKFNKDLIFEYGSTDKTYTISFEYSTDGVTYNESDYKITNWADALVKNPYSSPVERYILSPSVTIPAGSPIYWSGTKVGERWTEIYDAIVATKETDDKVYVKTIFTVVQPSYTKSFELGEVIYSDGGNEVSERGMAEFN